MLPRIAVSGLLLVVGAAGAAAQYARPVEVPVARPVTPIPVPAAPLPNPLAPTPLQPALAITNPPTVVVPGPPPVAIQGGKTRPRRCWCFARNPVSNVTTRTTCEVECCKDSKQDQRC